MSRISQAVSGRAARESEGLKATMEAPSISPWANSVSRPQTWWKMPTRPLWPLFPRKTPLSRGHASSPTFTPDPVVKAFNPNICFKTRLDINQVTKRPRRVLWHGAVRLFSATFSRQIWLEDKINPVGMAACWYKDLYETRYMSGMINSPNNNDAQPMTRSAQHSSITSPYSLSHACKAQPAKWTCDCGLLPSHKYVYARHICHGK